MNGIALALASTACSAAGQLLLRAGVRGATAPVAGSVLAVAHRPLTLLGLACWGLSTVAWIAALRERPLTGLYGLGALNYVLVPLAAHRLFGEPFNRVHAGGSLLVAAGVVALLFASAGGPDHAQP